MTSTPTLLTLPRELRDKLLSLLIACHTDAPKEADDPENREVLNDIDVSDWHYGHAMHVKRLNRVDLIPTLLVNRQLKAETEAAIELFPNDYALHAMLVNDRQLWPTWTRIPKLVSNVDNLHFSVKSVGPGPDGRRSIWAGGCGGPPIILWFFYGLLERFLKVGPFVGQHHKTDQHFTIKNLDIEVLTPDVPAEKLAPEDQYPGEQFYNRTGAAELGSDLIIHPKKLAHILMDHNDSLLRIDYHHAEYSAILFERVGTMRILVDGEVQCEYNLAERLHQSKFDESFGNMPREQRAEYYKKWKSYAYKTRVEHGLPVIASSDTKA